MREILRRARLPLPFLAEKTEYTLGYLKQLSAGNDDAGRTARQRLARAFRDHAQVLMDEADVLDPPPAPPDDPDQEEAQPSAEPVAVLGYPKEKQVGRGKPKAPTKTTGEDE